MSGGNRLQVRYFAGAAAAAGVHEETVDLPVDSDVRALRDALGRRHPPLVPVLVVAGLLLDGVAAREPGRRLDGVRQVDVLPPFAGG